MTFEAAEKRLFRIAKNRYCSIKYERTKFADGLIKQECGLYIDGYHWGAGNTWSEAFADLKGMMEEGTGRIEPSPEGEEG